MSIATEIEQLQKNLTDSYAAVQTKGGTVPTAKGYTNLPAAITSIPTGGGGPAWSDPHQVDTAGRLTLGNTGVANFAGIKTIADKALWRCNLRNSAVTEALFPDLEVVEDSEITSYSDALTTASALGEAFLSAIALTTFQTPKLRKIGKGGLSRVMALSKNVENVFVENAETGYLEMFPELVEVGDFGLLEAFRWTKILQYAANNAPDAIIVFPKLKTLGVQAMRTAFGGEHSDDSFPESPDGLPVALYFPALTTVDPSSFKNMLYYHNGSGSLELHFLSTMEATITACAGYPSFGASGSTNVSVYFDAENLA